MQVSDSNGELLDLLFSQKVATSPQFPAGVSQSVEQASVNQLGAESQSGARQEPKKPGLEADGWQLWRHSGMCIKCAEFLHFIKGK